MSRWLVLALLLTAERAGAQSQPPLQWPTPPTFSSVPPEDWQRNQPPPHRPAEGDWHRPARKVEPMPINPAVTVAPQGNPWLLRPKPPLILIPSLAGRRARDAPRGARRTAARPRPFELALGQSLSRVPLILLALTVGYLAIEVAFTSYLIEFLGAAPAQDEIHRWSGWGAR